MQLWADRRSDIRLDPKNPAGKRSRLIKRLMLPFLVLAVFLSWMIHQDFTPGFESLNQVAARIQQAYGANGYSILGDGLDPEVNQTVFAGFKTAHNGFALWPFGGFARAISANGGREFFLVADNVSLTTCTQLLQAQPPEKTIHVRVNGAIKVLPLAKIQAQAVCDLADPVGISVSWQVQ